MPHEETLVQRPRAPIRSDFFAEQLTISLFLVATDYFNGIMGYCFSPCAPTGRCVPLPLKEKRPWCPASRYPRWYVDPNLDAAVRCSSSCRTELFPAFA